MTTVASIVDRLLSLGAPGHRPAGAVVGVRTPQATATGAGGWALLPTEDADGVRMRTETLLDLASVTKAAATTVLAMRLVADGRLDLAAPVRELVPTLTGDGTAAITVEQLFTHTAGFPPWVPLYYETTDREQAVELIARTPLATAPGATWRYSDLGLILAGRVIEVVSGLRLDEAFRTLVAEPLGLADIGYGPVDPARAAASSDSDAYELTMIATDTPYPVPYAAGDFPGWRRSPTRGVVSDGNAAHALAGVAGHAGLFGTVADLLRLGVALLPGSGFVPETVLGRFSVPTAIHPEQAVGFRRRVVEVGGETATLLWHGGFTGTYWAVEPRLGLVVAGGATRLHGTVGPLPSPLPAPGDPLPTVVPGPEINETVLAGALEVIGRSTSDTTPATTPAEDR